MRIFVVVLSLIAFVYADDFSYNYRPVQHSTSGMPFISGSPYNSLISSVSSQQPVPYNTPAGFSGYETEFYSFTAPEDVFDDHAAVQKTAESLKQKVRVIFIKNPENIAYENAVLSLIKQAAEQKTAIYVLNKQHDISDLSAKLNVIQSDINRKPEVHFVKYRTLEDAYNAQIAIQSQYDSSDGSAQNYDAGHMPLLNFASPAPIRPFQTPNSEYLPGIFPRFTI